jgi:hypothetical protein
MGLSILDGPPRTLHFEINEWANKSWGFHSIDRRTINCETAISANGSRMNRCDIEVFHHYLIPYARSSEHTLYLQPTHSGYSIDDETRTLRGGKCACSWETEQFKPDDLNCSQTARTLLPGGTYLGSDRIAGRLVMRYRDVGEDGTLHQLSLAPELKCEVMDALVRWKGTLGIPGAQWRYRVTSYTPGEPPGTVFQIPAGYRVETTHE